MAFKFEDLMTDEKCYLVFKGTPSPAWMDHNDAERLAAEMCEEAGDKATIMVIPRASLEHAMVAVNHGVVMHALKNVEEDED